MSNSPGQNGAFRQPLIQKNKSKNESEGGLLSCLCPCFYTNQKRKNDKTKKELSVSMHQHSQQQKTLHTEEDKQEIDSMKSEQTDIQGQKPVEQERIPEIVSIPYATTNKFTQKQKAQRIQELPQNQLFFLQDEYDVENRFIIAQIIEKPFKLAKALNNFSKSMLIPETRNSSNLDTKFNNFQIDNSNIFSLYDKGVKMDNEALKNSSPQIISQYIAKKFQEKSIIIDAFCGIGSNMVHFAQESNFVIGIDLDPNQISMAQNNCNIYGIMDQVDVINSDFLDLQALQGDLTFLNPSLEREAENNFHYIQHIKPCIYSSMKLAYDISQNFALLLPKQFDLFQLPAIMRQFLQLFQEDQFKPQPSSFSVSVELLNFNQKVEYYLIMFGDIAEISTEQELHFLVSQLISDTNQLGVDREQMLKAFHYLLPFIGVKGISYHIHQTLEIYKQQKDQTQSKDIIFIDTIVSNSNLQITRSEIVDKMNNSAFPDYSIPQTFGISSSSSLISNKGGSHTFKMIFEKPSEDEKSSAETSRRKLDLTGKQIIKESISDEIMPSPPDENEHYFVQEDEESDDENNDDDDDEDYEEYSNETPLDFDQENKEGGEDDEKKKRQKQFNAAAKNNRKSRLAKFNLQEVAQEDASRKSFDHTQYFSSKSGDNLDFIM